MRFSREQDGTYVAITSRRGPGLLRTPMTNKGTAFSEAERREFGLEGLLPPGVTDLEQQSARAYRALCRKPDALEKYIGLRALQDRNETLFYRVLCDHLEELLPIVYTPTVGEGCQFFSRIMRRPRGVWISPDHAGRVEEILMNVPKSENVRLICVTDNERILGLGDQGVGGMGIPIGKLALYTAAAGIHPTETLPVSLDVGTDNQDLLDDDLYVGWRKPRVRGDEYHALVDEFVTAVKKCYPKALLQWEDFKKQNAFDLLDRYKHELLSFNDDIQGTAAVALAAVIAAGKASETRLARQRVVILGAGAAGIGIGRQLRDAMRADGLEGAELVAAVALIDSRGLLTDDRELRDVYKKEFAWPADLAAARGLGPDSRDLAAVVAALEPTVLIGTSGTPNSFPEAVIRDMAAHCERPAIFPFSNPTSKAEAKPVDIVAWTEGRALIATGSPFDPVPWQGRTVPVAQGNNVYIFPGVGLGALVAGATRVSEAMFTAAARALSEQTPEEGALFPAVDDLRAVTAKVAEAVVAEARDSGLGRDIADEDIPSAVRARMWTPVYPQIRAMS